MRTMLHIPVVLIVLFFATGCTPSDPSDVTPRRVLAITEIHWVNNPVIFSCSVMALMITAMAPAIPFRKHLGTNSLQSYSDSQRTGLL